MQVEGQHVSGLPDMMATGARVRNACSTYPLLGDSPSKDGLMPDVLPISHGIWSKDLSVEDGNASD